MTSFISRLGLPRRSPPIAVEAPEPSPEQIAARAQLQSQIQGNMSTDVAGQSFDKSMSDEEREAMIMRARSPGDAIADERVRLADDEVRSASSLADEQTKETKAKPSPVIVAQDLRARAAAAPATAVTIAVAAIALPLAAWAFLSSRPATLSRLPAAPAVAQIAPPAPAPPTRAELQALSDKYDDLSRRYAELSERASRGLDPQVLAQFAQRLDGVESLANALKQNGASAPAVVTAKVDEIKADLDTVKAALLDLASNVDGRLAQAKPGVEGLQIAREPAYTPRRAPRVAAKAPNARPTHSALPVEPAPGDAPTTGSTTGSPSRGFTLATSGDVSQLRPGDTLPAYGRVNLVRRSDGGVFVDTEGGTIFVRDR